MTLVLVVFALGGAIWGAVRPTLVGVVAGGGVVTLSGAPGNTMFAYWVALVVSCAGLGMLLAVAVYARSKRSRGLAMLCWIALVVAGASIVFAAVGQQVAGWMVPVPEWGSVHEGMQVRLPAAVRPGGIVALFPALCAALAYWCCVLVDRG